MTEIRIVSSDDVLSSNKLKEELEGVGGWDHSIRLETRVEEHALYRTVDPTVLVAIFTMSGTAIGALITGLLQIAQANAKEKIVLVSKNGSRIEIEAKDAQSKIPELVEMLKSMDVDIIRLQ
jgi:hypothetical protein